MTRINKASLDYYHLKKLPHIVDDPHTVSKEAWLRGSISHARLPVIWNTDVEVVCVRRAACVAGDGIGRFGGRDQRLVAELVTTVPIQE